MKTDVEITLSQVDESLKPFINPDGTVRWLDHMAAMSESSREEEQEC